MAPFITTLNNLKDLQSEGKLHFVSTLIDQEVGEVIVMAEDKNSVIRRIISPMEFDLFVKETMN